MPDKCTLSAKTIEKARKELNEIPSERQSHIDTLKKWVEDQPHITCRTDDAFLLRFLRASKFSQLRAQTMLDNFCTVRSVESKGAPEWFSNMDPTDPKIMEMLDLGCSVILPGKGKNGQTVLLVGTGNYDPKVHDYADVMRIGFMTSDVLLLDEETQVNGITVLLDFTQFGSQHVFNFTRDNVQKSMKCWTDTYPTRNKSIQYYNTPTVFNPISDLCTYFMKDKLKKRLKFHKDSLASLQQEVPASILPREFGGQAGPLKTLIQNHKQNILANRDEILKNSICKVDESKRPAKATGKVGGDAEVVGTFRKLNVD